MEYSLDGYDNFDYSNNMSGYEDMFEEYEYKVYIYPGYSFERPVYMYIWGILVIITFLANIIVISVLLQKKMRNPTNLILVAIAISDSLTGLVTLPSYWAVYGKYQPSVHYSYNACAFYDLTTMGSPTGDGSASFPTTSIAATTFYLNTTVTQSSPWTGALNSSLTAPESTAPFNMPTLPPNDGMAPFMPPFQGADMSGECMVESASQEGYHLPKDLCRFFMISKYFLSKTFHTVSIWLTLFLGFQRFISVASPFRAQKIFSERNIVIICLVICILAPVLHVYHLTDEKASHGMCQWDSDYGCGETCAYVIVTFVMRHFLPCFLLVIFTVLFIRQLTKSAARLSHIDSNMGNSSMQHRQTENRRILIIVTLIVVVFLIPEVPYGCFLLSVVIDQIRHAHMDLEKNRAIHLAYEISLVLSFHANFYIYTFFNRRFRKSLLKRIVYPCLSLCGVKPSWDVTTSVSGSSKRKTANTDTGTLNTRIEMKNIVNASAGSSANHTPETSRCLNGNSHPQEEESNERSKFLN